MAVSREELIKQVDELAKKVGAVKKEGSNVVSFRCNARYQATIRALAEEIAPGFDCEIDDLPISTVVKFALEFTYVNLIGEDNLEP